MNLTPPAFMTPSFFGVSDAEKFWRGVDLIVESMPESRGIFASDNLFAFQRSLGFMRDGPLVSAYQAHCETVAEKGALWRLVTLAWAARSAAPLDGDFVECGCYRGTTARVLCDLVEFTGNIRRRYYLYDLFEHDASMPHHAMPDHGPGLTAQVRARFANLPNVVITEGRVPDSLAIAAPDKIAFMHLDLNNADAEIGALEVLFDRVVPGGIVVLDDFGWLGYERQRIAEVEWFGARKYQILELPTGQGVVVKRG